MMKLMLSNWILIFQFIWQYPPQRAAHKISELNLFLYLRISGVSESMSCDVGVTLTLTCDSLREAPPDPVVPPPAPPAPKPKVRKLRCFCCRWGGVLLIACRYCNITPQGQTPRAVITIARQFASPTSYILTTNCIDWNSYFDIFISDQTPLSRHFSESSRQDYLVPLGLVARGAISWRI